MNTATCTPAARGPSVAESVVRTTQSNPHTPCAGDGTQSGPATDGRAANGRFGPGNLGGPGNPFARQMASFRSFLMNANTTAHMQLAFDTLMRLVAEGNIQALKLYFAYIFGKPAEAVDPDRLDAEEWRGYKETAGMMGEAAALMQTPAPDFPLETTRIARAAVTETMRQATAQALMHPEEQERQAQEKERRKQEEHAACFRKLSETVEGDGAAPSGNEDNGKAEPSADGDNGPSTSGDGQVRPSTNGDGQGQPSTIGENGRGEPSTIGENGQGQPSTNGKTAAEVREEAIAGIAQLLGYKWPPA